MISKDEVKHIAKLARLELTEKEMEKMQKDMSAILDYFNLLKKADSKGTPPEKTKVSRENASSLRKDEVISSRGLDNELIASAPDKKDGYIKVKTIL